MKIGFRKGITLKEALIWVVFVGFAAHVSIWLINSSANAFYDTSVYRLTGKTVEQIK